MRVWDIKSATQVATFTGHAGSVQSVAIFPDGRRVVSGGEDGLRVWDLPKPLGPSASMSTRAANVFLGVAVSRAPAFGEVQVASASSGVSALAAVLGNYDVETLTDPSFEETAEALARLRHRTQPGGNLVVHWIGPIVPGRNDDPLLLTPDSALDAAELTLQGLSYACRRTGAGQVFVVIDGCELHPGAGARWEGPPPLGALAPDELLLPRWEGVIVSLSERPRITEALFDVLTSRLELGQSLTADAVASGVLQVVSRRVSGSPVVQTRGIAAPMFSPSAEREPTAVLVVVSGENAQTMSLLETLSHRMSVVSSASHLGPEIDRVDVVLIVHTPNPKASDTFLAIAQTAVDRLPGAVLEVAVRDPLHETASSLMIDHGLFDVVLDDLTSESVDPLLYQLEELGRVTRAQRRVARMRQLAAHHPDLASSLNNLSTMLSKLGRLDEALNTATEAVETYRRLAYADPAAFLPNLAMALNNLSVRQADTGDRSAALTSITEAVDIHRRLAEANPAAFLPNLATSLNTLANQQANTGDRDAASDAWAAAAASMPSPGARADLTAAWARWLADHHQPAAAAERLRSAAADADAGPDNEGDASDLLVLIRARQAIRGISERLDHPPGLPIWATAPLRDDHVALLNTITAGDWPAIDAALRHAADDLRSADLDQTLAVVDALYPRHPAAAQLRALREEVRKLGIDEALRLRQADADRRTLLDAWIATTTWTESLDFLRDHADALGAAETRRLLSISDQPAARQHLAILDLAETTSTANIVGLITNADTADEATLDALEAGDLDRVAAIALASQALQERPTTLRLVAAILTAVNGKPEEAADMIVQLGQSSGQIERRALAARLRSLIRARPDLAGLAPTVESLDTAAAE